MMIHSSRHSFFRYNLVRSKGLFQHLTIVAMSRSSRIFLALIVSWAASIGFVNAATQWSLTDPILINSSKNGDLYLEQVKDTVSGTYSMRLTFIGGNSWIGIGINTAGQSKMTPSSAVIGRVEDDGVSTSVMHYSMTSDAEDASGVRPFASNTLQNVMFNQPDETTTILTFTQDLSEMGVSDSSTWIIAVGLPDNAWAGKHDIHGSFQLALSENCVTVADPTPSPTVPVATDTVVDGITPTLGESPTQSPTAATPTVASGGDNIFDGDSGIDSSLTGLSNGGQNAATGIVFLKTTRPNKNLWMAHGIILALAWGVVAPLGIGASVLRELITNTFGQSWYNIHVYLNMSTVLMTAIGFLIAVVAMQKEGEDHFKENTHTRAGLAIMILVVMQALAGYFRPSASGTPPPSSGTSKPLADGSSDEESANLKRGQEVVLEKTTEPSDAASTAAKKPLKRLAWELSHRLGGMTVLGLAWYNCYSGIKLQVEDWDDTKDWTNVFLGVTATVSSCILISACMTRSK
jgi:hypothetical protein